MTSALGALARCLANTITTHRTARIPLGELRRAAHAADLSLAGDPGARRKLADAIDELVTAGIIRLPVKRDAWDNTVQPPLPAWVQRPTAERAPKPSTPPATTAWHARLSWAAAFIDTERPSTAELALLHVANRYLAEHKPPAVVPIRERSWELLHDEKALDTLSRGRLFTPQRLTLANLHCERIPLPIAQWQVGDGQATLLVENHTTAHTLARWLPASGRIGVVIYSAGSQLPQILASLPTGSTSPLYYYGDLDLRGIEIAADGHERAQALGLGPLTPASNLYRLLLAVGNAIKPKSRPRTSALERVINWLPSDLHEPITAIITAGLRIPQEATGVQQFAALNPTIFDPLDATDSQRPPLRF